jgi:hypothetical protein
VIGRNEFAWRSAILLKLRDSEGITFEELYKQFRINPEYLGTGSSFKRLIENLETLKNAGFVNYKKQDNYPNEPYGEITINRTFLAEIQHSLGISLSLLSQYEPEISLLVRPFLGKPEVKRESSVDLFVAMPFSENLQPVFDDHIKKVVTTLNFQVIRADDAFSSGSVITSMWNDIFHCKVVIADCTGRNPNVFYEIGIAHVIGKPVILITQNIEDIPFDLRYIRFILYEFTPRGMALFEGRLQATILNEMNMYHKRLSDFGNQPFIPWPVSELDPKEPCHCGSGKRFENCHGKS